MSDDAPDVLESTAGPASPAERILFVDLLRGMALFGILAANMRGFNAPSLVYGDIKVLFHGRADMIAQAFIDIFIQGKFVTLFSFLFGLGFAIQMTRAEARGARFMSFYPRRLAALALFGAIHGILIWWGDILLMYSIAGAVLLTFRNRSQKTVLWWAGGIFSLPILVITGFYVAYLAGFGRARMMNAGKPPEMEKIQAVIAIYSHGTVGQRLRENWVVWTQELSTLGFALYILFLFLLGLWVWRAGIIQRLDEYQPILKRVCAWCLPSGIVLNTFVTLVSLRPRTGGPSLLGYFANVLALPSEHLLSAGYASGLALLFYHQALRRRLTPFAAVGRMALTDYLTQSIVCTAFYYSTGLYGRVGPAMGLIPTVILYGAQVPFSNWWLTRYRFGPMEWLWRGMTYGKFPAMVRSVEPAAMPLASAPE